ncbi:MAG: ABC transporter substrate-binding protein [Eubacteriales bacterium]
MSEKKTKKSSDNAATGEYSEIYSQKLDVENIDKKMKKTFLLAHGVVIGVFLALIIFIVGQQNSSEDSKEYIGGNIIRLANGIGEPADNYVVGNPWKNASLLGMLTMRSLFLTDSTYTEINERLAEKYEVLDDGCTYVITMRENQFWSDGEEITVEDVVFSFHAFMSCDDVNSNMSAAFNHIVGATEYAEGKADSITGITSEGNTVTIQIDEPYSTFALMLTQFVPVPEHVLKDEDWTTLTQDHDFFTSDHIVCSGQYVVGGLDEEKNMILVHNPYYTDTLSDIETILFCWDYENTELDYYPTNDITKMVSYRSMKGYEEHEVSVYYYRYFVFNLAGGDEGEENSAMQDVRVRQAINHAIDVETLLKDVYLDKGEQVYGGSIGHAEEVYDYDPEKAKALLEEADYDFSRTFVISYYSGDSNSRIFLERVKAYLEAVGLTVELYKAGSGELYENPNYDMMMKNLSSLNTEDWYSEYLSTNANLGQLLGREGEFDDLVSQLTSTPDIKEYNSILQELVDLEQGLLYKMPMFLIGEAVYINGNRLSVPDDMVFGNTRYRSDVRLDEWFVIKE